MATLIFPLGIFVALASYAAGLGLHGLLSAQSIRPSTFTIAQVLSAALHMGWSLSAGYRRAMLVTVVTWPVSVYFCRRGFDPMQAGLQSYTCAFFLEAIPLIMALSLASRSPWADRLARWRRARSAITAQLYMGEGLGSAARERFGTNSSRCGLPQVSRRDRGCRVPAEPRAIPPRAPGGAAAIDLVKCDSAVGFGRSLRRSTHNRS